MELYIGNKNYSSWSLRAWLMLEKSEIAFNEVKLQLFTPDFYHQLEGISPNLKVPALVDGEIRVWDSLAICEYINDTYISGAAWPNNPSQKAKARSIACEMHSGFNALRDELPMNVRATRCILLSDAAKKDVQRIDDIWSSQMEAFDTDNTGSWLFGTWSICDMMFAPVVMRFQSYGIPVSDNARCYMKHVTESPEMQRWIAAALEETEIVVEDEAGVEL
ncbi:glutathione S-transferase family protein [Shewanella sp. D64]|uniref:glutathione S-transferase family protein n=1 Tax=unclassified Shewanella TaxID=196818 RepID=UPI0022BA652A|nr:MULTISPECIES: glutathione S-transferase family protein [unclassified Shewanella]MEC4727398.1 glutathione S-transferase family protein [Shewanella sp. D64]MEC4739553.1 glutathione S-transferase family protein [Shewanella sp. E94]WBJ96064.1 glutathione S-transferase family protein [Shewanella sp. MTB7]